MKINKLFFKVLYFLIHCNFIIGFLFRALKLKNIDHLFFELHDDILNKKNKNLLKYIVFLTHIILEKLVFNKVSKHWRNN
jgi:hypothetical protein